MSGWVKILFFFVLPKLETINRPFFCFSTALNSRLLKRLDSLEDENDYLAGDGIQFGSRAMLGTSVQMKHLYGKGDTNSSIQARPNDPYADRDFQRNIGISSVKKPK